MSLHPTCAQSGGAIRVDNGGSVTVTETTLASNAASRGNVRSSQPARALRDDFAPLVCARKGGAVGVGSEGYANITRSTLSSNSADVRVAKPTP